MTDPVLFNRRLSKSELNTWISLVESQTDSGCMNRALAADFLELEDTLSFVSSVDDEMIGGTAIYKDRTRLGMILASVAVKKEFREISAYSIIKSSLPFFRVVAIRDIDALIPDDTSKERLAFPGSFELDLWTKSVLERIGFEEKSKLFSYSIPLQGENQQRHVENKWDSHTNIENAKKLIWDSSKTAGMTNSLVWTAFDFAVNQGNLRSVTLKDSMKLVTSIYYSGKTAIIGLIISDDDFTEDGMASSLVAEMIRETDAEKLILPLIGDGQDKLIEALADELGGSLKRRSMTLMRKQL
ncbi:MAG: hypothetical protein KAR03_07910 [Candidatus Thorarchaeota archaeon]|nr:hypothetical protein [Candidatus Thorarchaeota archaeon]